MLWMAVPYLLLVSLYLWEEIFQQLMLYCLAILIVTLNKRTSMQSAFCINRHYKITKHKEAPCFLSGGFRRSPTNEEKKEQGRGCEKICLWGWKLTDSYLYWLNWHLSLNKLPPLVSQILKLVPSSQSTLHQLCIFKPSFFMTNLILEI